MDNHPIPQDVTGFQFKLIGNMTIKQFAYLASGVVMAWILLQFPISLFIKLPFSIISALLGIGLAYLPVSGRPMDLMIGNFIKALIRPTQFVYEKTGGQLYYPHKTTLTLAKKYQNDINPFPKDKLKIYLESLNSKPKINTPYQAPISTPVAIPEPIVQPIQPIPAPTPAPAAPPEMPMKIDKGFEAPIKTLKRMTNIGTFSIPDSANVVTGVTKDPRGNTLSNILVEVKDKEGNPIRAFKTNELGRFASATPLINGTYTMEFEDPKDQNKFEKITINVTGQIIMPIVAVSIDTREELRRSLFNAN